MKWCDASFFSVLRKPRNNKNQKKEKKVKLQSKRKKEEIHLNPIKKSKDCPNLWMCMCVFPFVCVCWYFSIERVSPVRSMQDHTRYRSVSSIFYLCIYKSIFRCLFVCNEMKTRQMISPLRPPHETIETKTSEWISSFFIKSAAQNFLVRKPQT